MGATDTGDSSRALRWHFGVLEDEDDRGVNETRGLACELVAWRFVTRLSRRETIDCLCHDLPPADGEAAARGDVETGDGDVDAGETSPLLGNAPADMDESFYDEFPRQADYAKQSNFATIFAGLNALEIAAVAEVCIRSWVRPRTDCDEIANAPHRRSDSLHRSRCST